MNVSIKAVKHLEESSDNFMRVSPADVGHCAVPYDFQYLGRDTWVVLYLIKRTCNVKNHQIENCKKNTHRSMENKILFINLLNSNTIHVYDLNNVQNVISDIHNLGCRTIYSPVNRNYNTLSTMYCNIGTRQGNKNYISFKIKMQKMIIVIRQSLNYIFFLHQRKKKGLFTCVHFPMTC